MRLVISSMGRAGKVSTLRYFEGCELFVPEAEGELYEKRHPGIPVVTHPDTLIGLDAKRQEIMEWNEDVFHLDDDSIGVYRIYRRKGGWKRSVMTPERSTELINRTGETARQMKAYLFGFASHANPMTFNALKPFKFGGYIVGGAFGVLAGSKLFFQRSTDTVRPLPITDYWICLLNAYYHRYAWIDERFSIAFRGTYTAPGGAAFTREPIDGVPAEILATDYLRKHFGQAVVDADKTPWRAKGPTRFVRNPGRRRIVLPWKV